MAPSLAGRVWKTTKRVLDFLIEQWFVIGIAVVIALAHAFPNVGRQGGIIQAEWSVKYLLVAIIFFVSGLSLPLANLYKRGRDWKLHIVTQATSFLLFPTIVFAIVSCVRAADPDFERFDRWALVGMVVMGCLPTTVSSNVVMTGQAGGDQSAATIEVMLGNLVGTFLSPALLQMFLSGSQWSFGVPRASGDGGTGELYRQVIMQLGVSVFVPLFVGEVIQYFIPKQVKWFRETFKLAKVGSLCLLGVIWSTFSGAFHAGAFEVLSASTLVFILVVNILLYIAFTVALFALARLTPVKPIRLKVEKEEEELLVAKQPLFDPSTTVALLFCGAAKGIVLGGPIVTILYGGLPPLEAATVSVPLVLYQGSQVVLGQVTVALCRWWMRRLKEREAAASLLNEGEAEKAAMRSESAADDRESKAEEEVTEEERTSRALESKEIA